MEKKIFLSLLCFVSVFMTGMNSANSQVKFSMHIGGTLPLGTYADCLDTPNSTQNGDYIIAWNVKTDKAGAAVGFDLGAKFRFPIPTVKGLGAIATADLFFNLSKKEARDCFNDYMLLVCSNNSISNYDLNVPKYVNIPVMCGLNYEYAISNNAKIWGEGAAGLDIGIITDLKMNCSEQDFNYKYSIAYESQYTFAFQFGAGVLLSDRLSLGLHYYNLGSQKVKGNAKYIVTWYGGGESDKGIFVFDRINPSMLCLRLGYHF